MTPDGAGGRQSAAPAIRHAAELPSAGRGALVAAGGFVACLLWMPSPVLADFTGAYGGVNGGFGTTTNGVGPSPPTGPGPGFRASSSSTGLAAPPMDGLSPRRLEDLPASMRKGPKSLDGR